MDKNNDNQVPRREESFPTVSLPDSSTVIGGEIGPYKLLSVLGEGGFGIVYLAEQKHPIKRQVALKIIKPGMDSKRIIARFEAERQALAMLDHPNIAHIFEAGSTEVGHPYFVMEYIKGLPITEYCDQHQLKIEERLKLFMQVCEAVQHAHQKGIIHRDIKPSNIVVSIQDGKAVPKVIDFGVAKAIGMPLTEKTIFTQQGQLIGTPEYMSPEQADLREKDIDIRTDIYSLGVVLYELLTGALPFEPKALREAGYAEIQRIIREQEPPRPSTKLSSLGEDATKVAQTRQIQLSMLVRSLQKELEWIPLMAIRKERELRYQTVFDLAEDVQNYIEGNPLKAGPESVGYRIHKFVRKHRGPLAALFSVGIFMIACLIIIVLLLQSEKSRNETERQLYCNRIAYANIYRNNEEGDVITNVRKILDLCPVSLRGWEWDWLYYSINTSWLPVSNIEKYITVSISSDGKQIVSGSWDGTLKIWDADNGNEIRTLSGHQDRVQSVCFSPDGRLIASGSYDKTIKIWDATSGTEMQTLSGHQNTVQSICFSPDGKQIASGSWDNTIKIWYVGSDVEPRTLIGHQNYVLSVCFSSDGRRIISGSQDKTIKIWDADSQSNLRTLSGHQGIVYSVYFSPDNSRIISGSADGTVKIWDAYNNIEPVTISKNQGYVRSVCFSPDGRQIAAGSDNGLIVLFDAENGTILRTSSGHESNVTSVCFSPNGKWIISGYRDNTIKLWDIDSDRDLWINSHKNIVLSVCFSPDRKYFASGNQDGTIRIWESYSENELRIIQGHQAPVQSIGFSPDGKWIVSGSIDNTIKIWNVENGSQLQILKEHIGPVSSVCFSPDGRRIASGSKDKTIKIWDIDGKHKPETLKGHEGAILSVCFSPDGKKIASGSKDETIKIWDIDTKHEPRTLSGLEGGVLSVHFSPDG